MKCPSCGFENAAAIKFCGECGQRLGESAKSAPAPEPRSYTPRHLVEKILASRSALVGERKQALRQLQALMPTNAEVGVVTERLADLVEEARADDAPGLPDPGDLREIDLVSELRRRDARL